MPSRFSKYTQALGFFNGLKFYKAVKHQKQTSLQFSNLPHPVMFRGIYSDYAIFEQIFVEHQYTLPIDLINPSTIIDLGANVGYASVYFANQFPTATIFSLEPEKNNFNIALENTKAYKNIRLEHGAIWHVAETIHITDNGFGEAGFMVENGNGPNAIRAFTVQEIMRLMDVQTIDILKIDIEGAEKEIFENNYETWVPNTKIIIVETHDRYKKGTSKAIFNTIAKYDFSLELKGENLILINNQIPHNY